MSTDYNCQRPHRPLPNRVARVKYDGRGNYKVLGVNFPPFVDDVVAIVGRDDAALVRSWIPSRHQVNHVSSAEHRAFLSYEYAEQFGPQ